MYLDRMDYLYDKALRTYCELEGGGEMRGTDFFLQYCDGKFREEDVCPEALPFVMAYYGEGLYWRDYVDWVLNTLCDIPLEFSESYEGYLRLEPVLDRALEAYRRGDLS